MSVVVPTRDRPAELARCVRAINNQTAEVELIVVDDRSREPGAVRRAAGDATFIEGSGTGPSAARNAGIAAATAPVICLIDDDCEPVPRWAALLAAASERTGTAAGPTLTTSGANAMARASQTIANHMRESSHDPSTGTLGFAPGSNLAMRQEVAGRLRFDERFPPVGGEDRAWCDRARALGHPVVWEARAIVVHHQRQTLRGFAAQQLAYGQGAARYRAVIPRSQRQPTGAGFYAGLVASGFGQGASVGALVGAAQALTAAGLIGALPSRIRRNGARSGPE